MNADILKFSIDNIDETETAMWLRNQLRRLRDFVEHHGGDEDMLEAVEYLIEDNEVWISDEVERALETGALSESKG